MSLEPVGEEVSTPTLTNTNISNKLVSQQVSAEGTNSVVDSNAIALDLIQELGETTSEVAPAFGSRLMDITQIAVMDLYYMQPSDFPDDYVFELEPGQIDLETGENLALELFWGDAMPFDISDSDTVGLDGFDETLGDPAWESLLGELFTGDNLPLPDYLPGDSTFGDAGVLSSIFGEDYTFDAVSQELVGVVRALTSDDLAFEDAISRVDGGVHVREAGVTDPMSTGTAIGDSIANPLLQPVAVDLG